jgi:hypothetical protein
MVVLRRCPLSSVVTIDGGKNAPTVEQPIDLAAFESLKEFDSSTVDTYSDFRLKPSWMLDDCYL